MCFEPVYHCRVTTPVSPVVSQSSSKQVKQTSSKEQLPAASATWVDEPWQEEDDAADVQQSKTTEE